MRGMRTFSAAEAARALNVSRAYIYQLAKKNVLAPARTKPLLFEEGEIESLRERLRKPTQSDTGGDAIAVGKG